MKKMWAAVPALLLITANASAFDAVARVVNVAPINETVNHPTQKCWTEYQQTTQHVGRDHNYGGAVLGTLIGGAVGSRFGKGSGKTLGTVAGAAIGAVTGDRIANGHARADTATVTTPVQRCQMVENYETRTTGYDVTYEYDHRQFTTRLPYHPGRQMRVNVAVTPR